ncbi:MAG TPA: TetR/AcrR family transcriptional regulator [Thermotogota bacterium]|nr:TetR/AcrR family transcriptional regulator [Thermotogota bacterium]HRW91554.1 TetR/AcrR family transcriptional regulator [Thermotogota bacterium]
MLEKKRQILRCARELFQQQGYKNTNVAEIMKRAGLGTGTFYNYFSSKDSLFMEIYLEENAALKKRIVEGVDLDAEPLEVVRELTSRNLQGMLSNPILKEWYNRDVFEKIERNFRKQKGLEQVDFLYDIFLDVVKRWQATGKMRKDIDAEMIMALFSAIITVELHKEEIGFQYFPELIEHLLELVMKGLSDNPQTR